jgi:predicted RNA polymerase sigma factor
VGLRISVSSLPAIVSSTAFLGAGLLIFLSRTIPAAWAEDTDWPQILALYELRKHMSDNPMVALHHAIAAVMVYGPSKGLELLRALNSDNQIAGHHRLAAVRAHLLEMAGDYEAAMTHYRIAASRTASIPEHHDLIAQAARLSESITKAGGV